MPTTPRSIKYVRRVMEEQKLSFADVSERTAQHGFKLSPTYLQNFLHGLVDNPRIDYVRAMAAALGKPQSEVLRAFGFDVAAKSVRAQPKKRRIEDVSEVPRKPPIGFLHPKKKSRPSQK